VISISNVPFFGIFETANARVRFACVVSTEERSAKNTRADTRVLKIVTADPRVGNTIGKAGATVVGVATKGAVVFEVVDVEFAAGALAVVVVTDSVASVVEVVVGAAVVGGAVVGGAVVGGAVVGGVVVGGVVVGGVVVVVVVSSGAAIWKTVT